MALVAVALVVFVAAACGDDGGDDTPDQASVAETAAAEVRPFAEVQDGEMTFEADPSDPTRGIFRVTTTEPMICAIVWGPDEGFGRFNNTLDMNGTGTVQHDVFLPDVEPGMEYRYVVQGTTADGTLYRSEPGSFVIEASEREPDDATADRGDNVALGADVVEVSSEFSDAFAAANVIDGDTSTEWATSGDGDESFITLDLGSDHQLAGVEFVTRSMADGSSITDSYTLTVDDGDALGPFPAGTVADPQFAEIDASGRVLRFEVATSTGGNVGAVEIRAFSPTG
jgi:hypothetical protein